MPKRCQPTACEPPATCGITGHALVSARLSEIAALRDRSGPPGAPALPPRFLRHCDEQTVVGVHAVLAALAARSPEPGGLSRHAVVAASRRLGRLAAAKTLAGLAAGGGVSVSPHIVPQCSLHSVAGAVSVALGMRGPHLGVGGGDDALAEGLFAAATIVHASATAGDPSCVWLVVTEWDAEPELDDTAAAVGDPVCRGLALAIEPQATDGSCAGGTAGAAANRGPAASRRLPAPAVTSLSLSLRFPETPLPRIAGLDADGGLAEFARALDMCREGTALVSWTIECPWGAEIRVSRRTVPAVRAAQAARLLEAA